MHGATPVFRHGSLAEPDARMSQDFAFSVVAGCSGLGYAVFLFMATALLAPLI